MTVLQITVLAILQGLTEFLPISSSGHLILVPILTGWRDQGLLMDVAVHVGSLGAVLLYFWRDLWAMLRGLLSALRGRNEPGLRLALYLIIGTIPALIVGFLISKYLGNTLRRVEVIAWSLPIFGVVLWLADRAGLRIRRIEHMTAGHALVIGIAQTLAFVPGTSRSGITIVAARLLGYERADAARFSFLLSIPAVAGAGVLIVPDLLEAGGDMVMEALITGGLTFLAALGTMAFLMRFLKRASMMVFVVYRILMGVALLILF